MTSPTGLLARLIRDRDGSPFTSLYDEYLLKRGNAAARLSSYTADLHENSFRPPGRLSPSSICGCKRRAQFSFLAVKGFAVVDPVLQRVFDRGDWIHHEWKATMKDMELVLGEEKFKLVAVEEPVIIEAYCIKGSADVVVEMNSSEPEVGDIKSQSDYSYGYKAINGVSKEHRNQLTCYLKGLGHSRGFILNDDKNRQNHRADVVKFSPDVWSDVTRWCNDVLSSISDNRMAPRHEDCEPGSAMARQCPYSKHCYGKTKSELKQMCYGGKRAKYQDPEDWWNLGLKLEKRARSANGQSAS